MPLKKDRSEEILTPVVVSRAPSEAGVFARLVIEHEAQGGVGATRN